MIMLNLRHIFTGDTETVTLADGMKLHILGSVLAVSIPDTTKGKGRRNISEIDVANMSVEIYEYKPVQTPAPLGPFAREARARVGAVLVSMVGFLSGSALIRDSSTQGLGAGVIAAAVLLVAFTVVAPNGTFIGSREKK